MGADGTRGGKPADRHPHVSARDRIERSSGSSDNPRAHAVVQHADDPFVTPTMAKYVADHIPDATYVELPGRNMYHHFVEPDWRASFQEVAEFLTGDQADIADDRVLATVLFTDIVDSTRRAAESATATGTPGSVRSAAMTSAGSPCTSARGWAPWPDRTTCSCPARCTTS